MLVLDRKVGESIMIGDDIEVKVSRCENGHVKLAIAAPKHVAVHRREVFDRIQAGEPQRRGA